MTTFLLVHGAYHGAWCWRYLTPLLEAAGARVLAPDLPGHGADTTPSAELSLSLYADHVAAAARAAGEPVALVGHSMAGAVIAQAAERAPEAIRRLVYLTAYMPGHGESIVDWARKDAGTKAQGTRVEYEGVPCLAVDRAKTREAFYQDATEADVDWVAARLRPEPLAVFRAPLALTPENFGRLPRDYISCRRDLAITADLQDAMLAALPARRVWQMDTGHSPFVVAPGALADILLEGEEGGEPRGE